MVTHVGGIKLFHFSWFCVVIPWHGDLDSIIKDKTISVILNVIDTKTSKDQIDGVLKSIGC
jgi:hypothetical protein